MGRYDATLARLKALLPPPAPTRGWSLVRLHAAAAQFANDLDAQIKHAESQMQLGMTLVRTDATPLRWDLTQAEQWRFHAVPDAALPEGGAGGPYLDAWGRILAVPRVPSEPDAKYARRILVELVRPATTNLGMAQVLDDALEIQGTKVLDAIDALKPDDFNGGGRFNHRVRAFGFEQPFATLAATFVVELPLASYGTYSKSDVEALLDRRKAAGTRLLRLVTTGLPPVVIPPPDFSLPRPSRANAPRTRFHQPRAFEPITDALAERRFSGLTHANQNRRFGIAPLENS
jgi:hypothetical protein